MNTNLRIGNLLTILVVGGGLGACTTQAVSTGTGGGGGIAVSGGIGGSTGAAGAPYATNTGTLCLPPTQMITNFTYMPGDAAAPDMTQVPFGTSGSTLQGGEDAYGSLTSDVTADDWHITGTVSDYSGFGLYFTAISTDGGPACNKVDASAFKGITFTVWGSAGGNMVTLGVSTVDDSVAYGWLDSLDAGPATPSAGTCVPTAGMGNGPYYHPGCADPLYPFAVTGTQAAPQTVSVLWSDFTMGLQKPSVASSSSGILSIYWNVPWQPTGVTPYAVDLHFDNLAFIPQ